MNTLKTMILFFINLIYFTSAVVMTNDLDPLIKTIYLSHTTVHPEINGIESIYIECDQLLKSGANPNAIGQSKSETIKRTALSSAVFRCFDSQFALDFFTRENYIEHAIMATKRYGSFLNIIKLLLNYGANPHFKFEREEGEITTAYELAKYYDLPDVVKLFDEHSKEVKS